MDQEQVEMKLTIIALLASLSLYAGIVKGQNMAGYTPAVLDRGVDSYRQLATGSRRGYLEETEISFGTILKSHHFISGDYNETHNGAYLRVNRWSVGTFTNSADVQSTFVTYNPKIYAKRALEVNLVAGVANGYEGWEYAQGDYLPLLGVSAQWMNLTAVMHYGVVAVGIELPLN